MAQGLDVYNVLREMHDMLPDTDNMSTWEETAIDAVNNVLYLAESVFCGENKDCTHTFNELTKLPSGAIYMRCTKCGATKKNE